MRGAGDLAAQSRAMLCNPACAHAITLLQSTSEHPRVVKAMVVALCRVGAACLAVAGGATVYTPTAATPREALTEWQTARRLLTSTAFLEALYAVSPLTLVQVRWRQVEPLCGVVPSRERV